MAKKPKILILDDSQIVTEMTGFLMERLGYETIKFTDGHEVIQYIEDGDDVYPDLIICDHYLGSRSNIRKTGIKVLRKLQEYGVDIPVIIASGVNNEQIIDKYFEIGASGYVSKDCPNYIDELERVVLRVMQKRNKQKKQ
jgi:CheY-like chemotaxis protein